MGKGKKRLLRQFTRRRIVLVGCIAAYLVWPYVTLYRIGDALRHGDVQTLTADVEWDSVREGLKEDIADNIMPKSSGASLDGVGGLPPFGSGFAAGIAGNMVDQAVTPDNLAGNQTTLQVGQGGRESLHSAWFSGLTEFEASFQLSNADADSSLVRVKLDLVQDGWLPQWRVTRVWVPMPLLHNLQTHTT